MGLAFEWFANTLELLHQVVDAADRGRNKDPPNIWGCFDHWVGLVALVALQVRWTHTARWLTNLGDQEREAPERLASQLRALQESLTNDQSPALDDAGPWRAIALDAEADETVPELLPYQEPYQEFPPHYQWYISPANVEKITAENPTGVRQALIRWLVGQWEAAARDLAGEGLEPEGGGP